MDAALDEIRKLEGEGEPSRGKLILMLHKLAHSFEDVNDTIHRYGHANLETAAVQMGINLGLFRRLTEMDHASTVEDIAQKIGADPVLINRLLRYLAAIGAVDEVGQGQYRSNHISKNLAEKLAEAGVTHYFETVSRVYGTLPAFLKRTGYRDPADELHTAFQDAWDTPLHVFDWFAHNSDALEAFNNYMALRRQSDVSWLTVYPVEQETKNLDDSKVLFVNVGGGIGHQCAQFKSKWPGVPGRVILQDLPHSIAAALPTLGVENMAHDFFKPQPILGARFYHLRAVLHNHPPHKVQQLLENIKSAMTSESILLVEEMIFPTMGLSTNAASIDMAMLGAFAAMERTESQWRKTFGDAGLKLVKTYMYNPLSYESVMDVRLPST